MEAWVPLIEPEQKRLYESETVAKPSSSIKRLPSLLGP